MKQKSETSRDQFKGNVNMNIWDRDVPVEESQYNWTGEPQTTMAELSGNPLTVVDLFSGAGGASLGFFNAGFNVILGIDHHKPSMDTFLHNHKGTCGIYGDITRVTAEMIHECLGNTLVKVIIAGVPCQGFSLNNRKRNPTDSRNYLFWEFIRFVRILQPDFLILENVSGMSSTANGSFVLDIKRQIESVGRENGRHYRVESNTLNAADFGVPQIRRRLIFLAVANGYDLEWPTETFGQGKKDYRTIGEAIGDLPSLRPGESKTHYSRPPITDYETLMRGDNRILLNHTAPRHPQNTIDKIGATLPGEPIYPKFTQRIRLSLDKPSPTQVAGGIRPQFQFGHPKDPRGLTVRERARIQSFPDRYIFLGGTVQSRVQTGNAVPPLLAEGIAQKIKQAIEKRKDKQLLFTKSIMKWGTTNYRDFIWRSSKDLLTILVAEFLLRKTRSENVDRFLSGFLGRYKSFQDLNHVPLDDLREELRPLGLYNQRAKALKNIALLVSTKTNLTYEEVLSLPYCGRYMASAIECFLNRKRRSIVDNNVQRVFYRYFSVPKAIELHKAEYLWDFAHQLLPRKNYVHYNYNLLDFSAMICKPVRPSCDICPVTDGCNYHGDINGRRD